jgi:hypothetical protein
MFAVNGELPYAPRPQSATACNPFTTGAVYRGARARLRASW